MDTPQYCVIPKSEQANWLEVVDHFYPNPTSCSCSQCRRIQRYRRFDTRPKALGAMRAALTPHVITLLMTLEMIYEAVRRCQDGKLHENVPQLVPWAPDFVSLPDLGETLNLRQPLPLATGILSYYASLEHLVLNRRTEITPGRYLKRYFPALTKEQVDTYLAALKPQTIEWATTADEIEWIYTHGPTSCMAHEVGKAREACLSCTRFPDHGHFDYASGAHPVRAYAAGDLAVAYLRSPDDRDLIVERALAWPDRKRYSRVYGPNATKNTANLHTRLGMLLAREGYTYGSLDGAAIALVRHSRQLVILPYLDGSSCVTPDLNRPGFGFINVYGPISAHSTSGLVHHPSTDPWPCDLCGALTATATTITHGTTQIAICLNCREERFFQCSSCWNWHPIEERFIWRALAEDQRCRMCTSFTACPACTTRFATIDFTSEERRDRRRRNVERFCFPCSQTRSFCEFCNTHHEHLADSPMLCPEALQPGERLIAWHRCGSWGQEDASPLCFIVNYGDTVATLYARDGSTLDNFGTSIQTIMQQSALGSWSSTRCQIF